MQRNLGENDMSNTHKPHGDHQHVHGSDCGHTAVTHDGHLHNVHGDHVDDHAIAVDANNPADCTPKHAAEHAADHQHGPNCGHEAVPHGDTRILVDGHRIISTASLRRSRRVS